MTSKTEVRHGLEGVVVDTTNLQGSIFTWWRDDDVQKVRFDLLQHGVQRREGWQSCSFGLGEIQVAGPCQSYALNPPPSLIMKLREIPCP